MVAVGDRGYIVYSDNEGDNWVRAKAPAGMPLLNAVYFSDANTVWAVELVRRALSRHGSTLRAFELDWWRWNESQRFGPADRPYHLTRSHYY